MASVADRALPSILAGASDGAERTDRPTLDRLHTGNRFPAGPLFAQIPRRICCGAWCEFEWVFFHQHSKRVEVAFINHNRKQPRLQPAPLAASVSVALHFHSRVDQSLRHTDTQSSNPSLDTFPQAVAKIYIHCVSFSPARKLQC